MNSVASIIAYENNIVNYNGCFAVVVTNKIKQTDKIITIYKCINI